MTHEPLPNRTQGLPEERYYSGDEGDQWSDELHDVLEELSTNALVSGPNRSVYDPENGQLYVPTEGGVLSLGNGTEWTELGQLVDPTEFANKVDSTGDTITGDLDIDGALDVIGGTSAASYSVGDFTITDDDDFSLKTGDVDHIRQPESAPTQFVQGAEIGPIESPEDTLTQLINASATTGATAGEQVGYTFSLNSQTAISVKGEADGSGGITSISFGFHSENGQVAEIDETGDLRISGEIEEGATF